MHEHVLVAVEFAKPVYISMHAQHSGQTSAYFLFTFERWEIIPFSQRSARTAVRCKAYTRIYGNGSENVCQNNIGVNTGKEKRLLITIMETAEAIM
jgi:hypothetical protein